MTRLIALILLLWVSEARAQTARNVQDYIARYKDIAIREMENHGIPASIKMGQGILESAAGTSELALQARNHFGIKCKKDWTGETYTYDDDAKGECFRKYDSAVRSFEDHSRFLRNNVRYAELFQLPPTDYKAWAHGLKKSRVCNQSAIRPIADQGH
jgi:flagellum-specific peptidoglycan hydrolase FlgJ